jgi:homoserine O-acetyltransferase/O-succinyltransferase
VRRTVSELPQSVIPAGEFNDRLRPIEQKLGIFQSAVTARFAPEHRAPVRGARFYSDCFTSPLMGLDVPFRRTSPHNTPRPAGMRNLPHVRIADDVRAQHKLVIEKFGLASLVLVVSGSMGAQQAYEWVVRYPDMVKRAAPIAGTARNTIHDSLFTETLVEAITSGPRFNKGFYQSSADVREGLLRHAKIWAVMGWSTEFFQQNRHKALGFSSLDDFIINFMYGYFSVMDPNNLLCMAWKWQRGDVSRHTGRTCARHWLALEPRRLSCRCLRICFSRRPIARPSGASFPMPSFGQSQTIDGHLALFGADPNALGQLDKHLDELLALKI